MLVGQGVQLLRRNVVRRSPRGFQHFPAGRPIADRFFLRLRVETLADRFTENPVNRFPIAARQTAGQFQTGLAIRFAANNKRCPNVRGIVSRLNPSAEAARAGPRANRPPWAAAVRRR